MEEEIGRRRVLVMGASPEVDGGRYAAKGIVNELLTASCVLVSDGHDAVAGALLYKRPGSNAWTRVPLAPLGDDRFAASFVPDELGRWELDFEGWVDSFTTWVHGTEKKLGAGQDVALDLLVGARLVGEAAGRAGAGGDDATAVLLREVARIVGDASRPQAERAPAAFAKDVAALVGAWPDLRHAARHAHTLPITIDPPLARFGAWYEMFPRSTGPKGKHGTFKDAEKRLPYVAEMGFDVLYLPPIHPIGHAFRKGPNNTLDAKPADVGSPWAIGAAEGGHKAVHPDLGTLEDFRHFVAAARGLKLEVALDIAFQASPDHPYVKEHPEWFLKRPDGSIQYAENPPKKYQDVYPFDFDSEDWRALWDELASIFFFWVAQGVTVFRVDNPHTKSLRFWEWCIAEVKKKHPEAIFLAEAFTRPKLMYALAKSGFSQSYTYFTWRHTKAELTKYMTELTRPPVSDFYRPNFWPNTPDILPEHLQFGGRAVFVQRLLLAATLSSSYGIYGPAYELMEHVARRGSEEYIDNEKYELRSWDIEREDSLRDLIARVNRIRHENSAFEDNRSLVFHETDNDHLLCFSRRDTRPGKDNVVLVVVNLDVHHKHSGWLQLDLLALGLGHDERYQVHDLVSEARYQWTGPRNFIELDPEIMPAHVFRIRRKLRSEQDFEYFL
jgi:starch synthase (maltosyl-transferring)